MQGFDTDTPAGKLALTMFAAFAEFEHGIRKECEWRSESDIGWRRRTAVRRDCCSARRLWDVS
jgi:predicted metal-dependent HD superfamily phosphohydrolase